MEPGTGHAWSWARPHPHTWLNMGLRDAQDRSSNRLCTNGEGGTEWVREVQHPMAGRTWPDGQAAEVCGEEREKGIKTQRRKRSVAERSLAGK